MKLKTSVLLTKKILKVLIQAAEEGLRNANSDAEDNVKGAKSACRRYERAIEEARIKGA